MSNGRRVVEEEVVRSVPTTLFPRGYTSALLVERYGESKRGAVVVYVAGVPDAKLVESGQAVGTWRVVREGVQLVGRGGDFLVTASPAQRALLAQVTPMFLSCASTALASTERLGTTHASRKSGRTTRRKAAKLDADASLKVARGRRGVYRAQILSMSGGDATWRSRIDDACGAASTPEEMAASIESLAAEGRELAAHAKSRGAEVVVTDGHFAQMSEYAATVRAAGQKVDAAPSAQGLMTGEIEWWEGVSLWFIKTLVDAFSAAHEVDPMIPKLQPVQLRSALKVRAKPRRKRPAAPPSPV